MSEKLSPEIAEVFAAAIVASDQRGWGRGFEAGYQAGFTAGAVAQKELMEKGEPKPDATTQPAQIILVDEGGIERVRDLMENPDA